MPTDLPQTIPETIPKLLHAATARGGDQPALGTISDGQLHWRTWNEIDADVRTVAQLLESMDVSSGDRIAQWAANSYEWILIDLASGLLGAVHAPLHASLSTEQVVKSVSQAGAKLLLVDSPRGEWKQVLQQGDLNVIAHGELSALPSSSSSLQGRGNVAGDQLATLLFTSGTTGDPRGVMLSHRNLVSNAIAVSDAVGSDADETRLCFLPLSHIYARTCDLYSWLYRGSKLVLAESRDTIVRDCQLAKPKVINGVPYFYQKIAQQLGDAKPGTLRVLFGGNLTRCFCGGAAIAPEVEQLFQRQGLPILSGYGLTEASPVISATAADGYRPGTVGRPLPDVEVQLSAEREILVRGSNVMLGYWNDQAATDQAIVDGWLHTGDLGEFDAAGHLRIVGRKKETIVLSTGKNVAPARVEQLLSGSSLVEHVCVVGDGRKCLAALIVPNPDALRGEIRRLRLWVWSKRRAVTHPRVRGLFRREIDRLLSQASTEEQVGPFLILDRNFSIDHGELTAKLSLRRATITANFAREIDRLYAG